MGKNYIYKCTNCDREFNTSGPWEFYRDEKGKRLPYGHPAPLTEEARLKGIHGFFADMLCLDCGREVNVVIEEFYPKKKSIWQSIKGLWKKDDGKIKCTHCKSSNLFLSYEDNEIDGQDEDINNVEKEIEINCPRCNKGKLKLTDQWSP